MVASTTIATNNTSPNNVMYCKRQVDPLANQNGQIGSQSRNDQAISQQSIGSLFAVDRLDTNDQRGSNNKHGGRGNCAINIRRFKTCKARTEFDREGEKRRRKQ
jgi:hypothetical protein